MENKSKKNKIVDLFLKKKGLVSMHPIASPTLPITCFSLFKMCKINPKIKNINTKMGLTNLGRSLVRSMEKGTRESVSPVQLIRWTKWITVISATTLRRKPEAPHMSQPNGLPSKTTRFQARISAAASPGTFLGHVLAARSLRSRAWCPVILCC